jgi:hypothetical protein
MVPAWCSSASPWPRRSRARRRGSSRPRRPRPRRAGGRAHRRRTPVPSPRPGAGECRSWRRCAAPRRGGRARTGTCRPGAPRRRGTCWRCRRRRSAGRPCPPAHPAPQLGRHLGAADDGDHGPLPAVPGPSPAPRAPPPAAGPAQADGREARHAVRRRLGAVRRAEGIHDEDIAQRRVGAGERFIVLFSPGLKRTFSSSTTSPSATSTPPRQSSTRRTGCARAATTGARPPGPGSTAGRIHPPWAAEVRHQHDPGTGVERHAHGRQGGADARIGGDGTILHRHVEILADQHARPASSRSSIRVTDRDMRFLQSVICSRRISEAATQRGQ